MKSVENIEPVEDSRWKQKYFNALEDLERQEVRWTELEKLLRRSISHLSLLGDGLDSELDDALNTLRNRIRNESDTGKIRSMVDAISEISGRVAGRHAKKEPTVPSAPLVAATDILLYLIDNYGDCEGAPLEQSLLQKRAENAESYEALTKVADAIVERMQSLNSFDGAQPPSNAGHYSQGFIAIRDTLLQLLQVQSFPSSLAQEVELVERRLQGELDDESLRRVLVALADLSAAACREVQKERSEIERFLLQLNDRLQEVDQSLKTTVDSQTESLERTHKMNRVVQTEVDEIRSTIESALQFEELKGVLQTRVSAIESHIQKFRISEEHHNTRSKLEIGRLLNRVSDMEEEAKTLRIKVSEERARATKDPLTGVYNRGGYEERVQQEYQRWRRYQKPLSLVLWDLDYFKQINDTYGHQAGDKVLKAMGSILSKRLRNTDYTARYGGEEFVSLLTETPIEKAQKVVDDVRRGVQSSVFSYHGNQVSVTISCGLAEFQAGDTPESVLSRADDALYLAKKNGRNRCEK